ncbi:MAG: hypothetical protein QM811_20975 [Pirellulales bacterium]
MPRIFCTLCVLAFIGVSVAEAESPKELILKDVVPYSTPGALPGPIVVSGKAVPLLVAQTNKGEVEAVVGAYGQLGKGAMVAFGHEGLISESAFEQPGGKQLLTNLLNGRGNSLPIAVSRASCATR